MSAADTAASRARALNLKYHHERWFIATGLTGTDNQHAGIILMVARKGVPEKIARMTTWMGYPIKVVRTGRILPA